MSFKEPDWSKSNDMAAQEIGQPQVEHKLNLVVTRNGIPLEDQAEGVLLFKEACRQAARQQLPEDIDETAYEEADMFSDWFGCDHEKRAQLTKAFALAIAAERERCAGIALRRAAVLKKIRGYRSEVAELETVAIAIRGAIVAEDADAKS